LKRLAQIHHQYVVIVRSNLQSLSDKDFALAGLMSNMKPEFHIPAMHDAKWEQDNKAVIALYRIISESRTTL